MITEGFEHGLRDGADAHLHGGAVGHDARHVAADRTLEIGDRGGRILEQRGIDLDPPVDLAPMQGRIAAGTRHVGIDLRDHERSTSRGWQDDADGHAEAQVAVIVGRSAVHEDGVGGPLAARRELADGLEVPHGNEVHAATAARVLETRRHVPGRDAQARRLGASVGVVAEMDAAHEREIGEPRRLTGDLLHQRDRLATAGRHQYPHPRPERPDGAGERGLVERAHEWPVIPERTLEWRHERRSLPRARRCPRHDRRVWLRSQHGLAHGLLQRPERARRRYASSRVLPRLPPVAMTMRVALVTGGGRGIGRAIAEALAGEGLAVAVAARTVGQVEETAAAIRGSGRMALARGLDVTDADAIARALAAEVGAKGVTVNAICPAYVATDMVWNGARNIAAKTGRSFDEAVAAMAKMNPGGRLIEPEEVAAAALRCLRDGGLNGEIVVLDGTQSQPREARS